MFKILLDYQTANLTLAFLEIPMHIRKTVVTLTQYNTNQSINQSINQPTDDLRYMMYFDWIISSDGLLYLYISIIIDGRKIKRKQTSK